MVKFEIANVIFRIVSKVCLKTGVFVVCRSLPPTIHFSLSPSEITDAQVQSARGEKCSKSSLRLQYL